MQLTRFYQTRLFKPWLICLSLAVLVSCAEGKSSKGVSDNGLLENGVPQTVEWTELMPADDLQALLNPPEYLFNVEEGSDEDQQLFEKLTSGAAEADLDPYQRALLSTSVREEFDGRHVRIPGFLVPLEFDDAQIVTQAFLVPYFGACIHVPPPPPNQIILLNSEDGVSLDDMYNPYWVTGTLRTTLYENELGTSAYAMNVASYELYTE